MMHACGAAEIHVDRGSVMCPMAAIGAITKLKELRCRVPEDVAVVGYDNIAIAEWYDPALTTVDHRITKWASEPCRLC